MRWTRSALLVRSFLPFAARFAFRHPTKLTVLRQHYRDYTQRVAKLAALTEAPADRIEAVLYELECSESLFRELGGVTGVPMHAVIYYALLRLVRPTAVVETGVNNGYSSRFLLAALERNRHGRLYSIDLPWTDPAVHHVERTLDAKPTGWLVPAELRGRWELMLGDATELLPKLLPSLGAVDIFIHDSLHTYEHMMFEFETAWPYVRPGGVLLSDDTDFNAAFTDFSTRHRQTPIMFNYRVGALRKPC